MQTVLPRDSVLDRLQEQLTERLEPTALAQAMAEGAEASSDAILERAAGWLRSPSVEV